jgi:hypothetical protein
MFFSSRRYDSLLSRDDSVVSTVMVMIDDAWRVLVVVWIFLEIPKNENSSSECCDACRPFSRILGEDSPKIRCLHFVNRRANIKR